MAARPKPRPRTLSRRAPGSKKSKDRSFILFLVEQLAGLGTVRSREMFGGHGLYLGDAFFAVVDEERVYFWADAATRAVHVEQGMGPFTPWPGHVMDRYWEVPLDVIEDAPEFARWARRALDARAASEAKPKPRPKRAAKRVTKSAPRGARKKTR